MSTIVAHTLAPGPHDDVARVSEVDLSGRTSQISSRVTFTVPAAGRLFLVSPLGSTNSLMLDLLSFRQQPVRGKVEVLGVDTARVAPGQRSRLRRRLGQILQSDRLLSELDVFTNIAVAAMIARRQPREYSPKINELLSWAGLEGRGGDQITKLTDAEKCRTCLARALINQPELIIADDPTRGLGERAEASFMRLILQVNEAGTPIIFATSNRLLAARAGGVVFDMPVTSRV